MTNIIKPKIALIGLGYLLEYLYPCYTDSLTENEVVSCIAATTADEAQIEAKRSRLPFPIYLNDNASMLRNLNPDIIFFAPPPKLALGIAQRDLKPYFEELRSLNQPLPDIYAFPPTPQAKAYFKLLGDDIHVCNILPNMTSSIKGISLNGKEGNTYISYAENDIWEGERREQLHRMFHVIGNVVEVPSNLTLKMLGTLAMNDAVPYIAYDIAEALEAQGIMYDGRTMAKYMRAVHEEIHGFYPNNSDANLDGASQELIKVLKKVIHAWYEGEVNFMISEGMDSETARKIGRVSIDLILHSAQVESKKDMLIELQHHATPGGVGERAKMCYEGFMKDKVLKKFRETPLSQIPEEFFRWIYLILDRLSSVVGTHANSLGGEDIAVTYTSEMHAMLYALLVKNTEDTLGEKGLDIVHQGTILYAKQRGTRMKKRAMAHGDETSMLNYMAYGEWEAEEGTFESEEIEFSPKYIAHIKKCPWYTAWKTFDMLEEGKQYCSCIDDTLMRSYNPELELGITCTQTQGGPYCEFIWNQVNMNEATSQKLMEQKKKLQNSCKKDWYYHIRHLLSAMKEVLGNYSDDVTTKTLNQFEILFGKKITDQLRIEDNTDYFNI